MINRVERDSFYSEMGFRLKQIRQIKKISQSELADALGMVTQTIQKYESGEIRMLPEMIHKCAEVFKIPVGYFYGEGSHQKKLSRASLMIASEVMMISSKDIQTNLYNLVCSISQNQEQDNEQ